MKRKYNTPALRYIDLTSEGMVAASENSVTFSDDEEAEMESALTNKQNLWNRESIWK